MALNMKTWSRIRPYFVVIFIQVGLAGLAIVAKTAINEGMSHYALVVYRQAVAAVVLAPFALVLERKARPKMTISVFLKILALGFLEPIMDQNLYYAGMQYTTATFVSALSNTVPALTIILAWMFRLEKVNLKQTRSLAKIGGTLVTIGGATIMTLVRGPSLKLPWIRASSSQITKSPFHQDPIKGALMIITGCMGWAGFVILQAITIKSYPAEMSVTAMMCFAGAVEGTIVAFVMKADTAIWSLHLDKKLLAYVYSGVICSGLGFFLQGRIMKEKGPVFVTSFNPLSMVMVAFFGSFFLAEQLTLGRITGAIVIVTGLYLVIWGKSKEQETSDDKKEQILPLGSPDPNIQLTTRDNASVGDERNTNDKDIP